MKNLFLIIALQISIHVFSQVSFIGFDRTSCTQEMNNTYTFKNYSSGNGSGFNSGYVIYKNDVYLTSDNGYMEDGKSCEDLKFINDSVGFSVIHYNSGGNYVYKTENYGGKWDKIGSGAPNYSGLYISNAHTVYLVTNYSNTIYVSKCSDLAYVANNSFLYDTKVTSDIFIKDTLLDSDMCNVDSLNILVKNGTDTITYHINFTSLHTGLISSNSVQNEQSTLYPNPSRDYFHLSISPSAIESVNLVSSSGIDVLTYNKENINNNSYPLYNLSNGVYMVNISTKDRTIYNKLIINN